MTETNENTGLTRVTCPPEKDPAVRTFVFAAIMIGFAVWCYTDRRELPEAWDLEHINDAAAYLMNNWGPVVLVPIGIIAALMGMKHLSRILEADENGIGYVGKDKIAWSDIVEVDASLLKSKGLILINAGEKKLKLRSGDMENFRELAALIEKSIPEEKLKV